MHGKNQEDAEADAMQQAFQQFMLSGGSNQGSKKKKKGKKQQPNNAAASNSSSTPTTIRNTPNNNNYNFDEHQRSFQRQKFRKQYWKILNAFEKTLEEDWIDVDDHLGDVIASIVNLRDRIRMSSKYLQKWQKQQQQQDDDDGRSSMPFFGGYRRNRPSRSQQPVVVGYLTSEDVELALSHDLVKHEKMLAGTRRLLASLNQAQEALGRRLDDLLKFHLDMNQMVFVGSMDDDDGLELFASQVVDWSRHVYAELALELYRKQCLAQTLLDSTTDQLLYQPDDELLLDGDDDDHQDSAKKAPIQEAQMCHRLWPRGNAEGGGSSCLVELLVSKPWEQPSSMMLVNL